LTVTNDVLSDNEAFGNFSATTIPAFPVGGAIRNRNAATLTVTNSTFIANQANGGAGGASGSEGLGQGGGLYLTDGGVACLGFFTSVNVFSNIVSTSDNDIFGVYTICS
jgi:hypothetical protein